MAARTARKLKTTFQAANTLWAPGFRLPKDRPAFPGPLTTRDLELRKAVRNNEPDYIKALLEAGVDPRKKDSTGQTAIDIAESDDIKYLLTDYISLRNAARAKAVRHNPKQPEIPGRS